MTTQSESIRKKSGRFDDVFKNIDGEITAIGKWVFVDIYEKEESKGGLLLIESKRTHIRRAQILSVGPEAAPYGVEKGQDCIIADFRMEVLDGNRGFIDIEQILAVVE